MPAALSTRNDPATDNAPAHPAPAPGGRAGRVAPPGALLTGTDHAGGAAATRPPGTAATGGRAHTVAAGETLSSIAARELGDGERWRDIWRANQASLPDPDRLSVGQTLVIPGAGHTAPTAPATHRVKPGESLSSIARERLGDAQRWRDIWQANRSKVPKPDMLQAGMELSLPGASAGGVASAVGPSDKPKPGANPKPPTGGAEREGDKPEISEDAARQMARIVAFAEANNGGASNGDCFKYVWRYIYQSGYGKIRNYHDAPDMKSDYARHFAEYMNSGDNARRWGLRRLSVASPYDAPRGAIVVVGPGTPGTRHPVAGDIAVARGDGTFINDGPRMRYGDPSRFARDGGRLLGVYVPE